MDLRVEHGTDTHVVEVAVDGTLETMAATIAAELRIDVETFELWKGDECVRHARPSDADTPLRVFFRISDAVSSGRPSSVRCCTTSHDSTEYSCPWKRAPSFSTR